MRRNITLAELPECLTAKDVASYLDVAVSKIYQLCRSDGFPRIVIGKRIIIPKNSFERWLKESTVTTSQEV